MSELILAAAIIAADQVVKLFIRNNFNVGEGLSVIPGVFHLTYVRNRGAAFSIFQNQPIVTILIPLVIIATCTAVLIKIRRGIRKPLMPAMAAIIAGGIGNLIDRVALGYVTDMIDLRFFPVFNIADIAVTCGCAFVVIYLLFFDREGQDRGGGHDAPRM